MRVLCGKCILAALLSWLIGSLTFLSLHSLPGDLALQVASSRFAGTPPDLQLATEVRELYGLNRPLFTQYLDWLGGLFRLEFGSSLVTGEAVAAALAPFLRNTSVLGCLGLLGGILIAFPLGYLSGKTVGGAVDGFSSVYSSIFAALPGFLLGVLLIQLFVVEWRWASLSESDSISGLVLPVLIVALTISAPLVRIVRNAVADVAASSYLTFARMRGVPAHLVFLRHGLRNAALPVLAYVPTLFVFLVYDLVVIEVVFNYPGVGRALHDAIKAQDVPVVQYATLVLVMAYLILTAAFDLASERLDPRIGQGTWS